MKDFFISYNRYDKQWAEWIAWTLEEAGYSVVIQAWDFQPGGSFVLDTQRAAAECEKTIAVLSANYLQSEDTQSEWSTAFAGDPQSLKRTLIPMRVGECHPEGVLKTIVYVDLVGVTEAAAHDLVLNALKERAKPAQKPGFPGTVTLKAERTEPEPVAFPGASNTIPAAQSTLTTFEFDVVTLSLEEQRLEKPRGLLGLLGSTSEVTFTVKLASLRAQAQCLTEDLEHEVKSEMVSIPGGQFIMGAPQTEAEPSEAEPSDNERPQHLVRVSPFFMGKYAVTQEQWLMVSGLSQVNCDLDPNCSDFKGLKRPVEKVSWFEAVEFCDRLARKTGRQYRLPSEAEWEYACRAGTTTPFSFGETITTALANYDGTLTYASEPKGDYRRETTDVGSFPPNAFGLYDMHGNVWEWCLDLWHENYQGAPTDGSAWVTGENSKGRVLRGGSWFTLPRRCRSASRDVVPPNYHHYNFGFRVVCSAP